MFARLFAAVCLLACASAAGADLVSDPAGSPAWVAEALRRIPAQFRTAEKVRIRVVSPATAAHVLAGHSAELDGWYSDCTHTIPRTPDAELWVVSWPDNSPRRCEDALCHEYGHYIWFRMLTHEEQEAYEALWKSEAPFYYASDYAATNAKEGFAEAFRLLCDPDYGGVTVRAEANLLAAIGKRLARAPQGAAVRVVEDRRGTPGRLLAADRRRPRRIRRRSGSWSTGSAPTRR